MKKIVFLIITSAALLIGPSVFALESLKMASGHYLAYETYQGAGPEAATLVLLPGINRALDQRDQVIKQMSKQKKFNFISYHSGLHPESLLLIPRTEAAFFKQQNVTLKDLAREAITLIKKLKIKNPVFVSLSYSSAISTELSKLMKTAFIIEVAPMIRFDESDPQGSQTLSFWKTWLDLFPLGSAWSDTFMKQAYSQYWSSRVDEMLVDSEDKSQRGIMIQAYSQLSLAIEGFDYRQQDFSKTAKRYYLFAENEDPDRADLQQQALVENNQQTGLQATSFVISDSGHVIPTEQPQQYINTLRKILKTEGLIN